MGDKSKNVFTVIIATILGIFVGYGMCAWRHEYNDYYDDEDFEDDFDDDFEEEDLDGQNNGG